MEPEEIRPVDNYASEQIVGAENGKRAGKLQGMQEPARCPIKDNRRHPAGCVGFKSSIPGALSIPCFDDNRDMEYKGCAYYQVYLERKKNKG